MAAQWIYRHVPLINSEVSLLVAFFTILISSVGFCGGLAVHFFDVDITLMAYISFWVFDFSVYGLLLTPWLPLPSLARHTSFQRLTFMVEIWVWLYVLIALTYEIPWVFGYQQIAYAEDQLWAYPWWSYIHGGDIRYLYVDLHVLWAEVWACLNALIAAFALRVWYKSGRRSVAAVFTLMFCAGMHIAPTVQYYSLEIFHGFPSVDTGNPNNFIAKFILSNSPWLIMPFFVFFWGTRALPRLYGAIKD
ncbi:MAG TPA: hypothetical protein VIN71_14075 [Pseudomonadales bacterium]